VIFIAWLVLVLLGLQFAVSLVNLLARHYLPREAPTDTPLVSILIPARDEERNIGRILSDLVRVPYPNLEILVYDDESTDRTAQIVEDSAARDRRVRLLPGTPLPEGWTGKNHACHRLASEASGTYYLFVDADVRVGDDVIARALHRAAKEQLALLSIFPVQEMETVGERISVPLMNWILLSMLPMPLIRRSRRPSLAAANGQFMLFPADVYARYQLHQEFRAHRVEDIAIVRFLKRKGHRVDTFLGRDEISCRMYDGLSAAIDGFAKNVFLFFGSSVLLTVLYAVTITVAPVLVFLLLPVYAWIPYVVLILLMRINVSLVSRQPVLQNLFYLVPQHAVFLMIVGKAVYNRLSGRLVWKGRNVLDG
jgi:glycosyltransferase involved in cell wall biosynthesis